MTYWQKMTYSIIAAVVIVGPLAAIFGIDNPVRFAAIIGTVTFIVLQVYSSSGQPNFWKFTTSLPPLINAAQEGDEAAVRAALKNGTDVNLQASDGKTALMVASFAGHSEIVKFLLNRGADVNVQGPEGMTALMLASIEGHLEIVQILINRVADLDYKPGYTALMLACMRGHYEIVKLLLDQGADVNIKDDENGRTALILAAREGHVRIVAELLTKSTDIDSQNFDGITALMGAAMQGHYDVVRLLVEKGADINTTTNDGDSALLIASLKGNNEIVEYLISEGGYADNDQENNDLRKSVGSENYVYMTFWGSEPTEKIENPTKVQIVESISSLDGEKKYSTCLFLHENLFIQASKYDCGIKVEYQENERSNHYETKDDIDANLATKLFLRFFARQDWKNLTEWRRAFFEDEKNEQILWENRQLIWEDWQKDYDEITDLPVIDTNSLVKYESIYGRILNPLEAAIVDTWHIKVGLRPNTFNYPNIPENKLKNAISSYAQTLSGSLIIALNDLTLFQSAKKGIIFTSEGIHWDDSSDKKPNKIRYVELEPSSITFDTSFMNHCIIFGHEQRMRIAFPSDNKKSWVALCRFLILAAKYSNLMSLGTSPLKHHQLNKAVSESSFHDSSECKVKEMISRDTDKDPNHGHIFEEEQVKNRDVQSLILKGDNNSVENSLVHDDIDNDNKDTEVGFNKCADERSSHMQDTPKRVLEPESKSNEVTTQSQDLFLDTSSESMPKNSDLLSNISNEETPTDPSPIRLMNCPHCLTTNVLPMPGHICPNCKRPLDEVRTDVHYADCLNCGTKGVLPMKGNICPNCKKPLM